MGNTFLVTILDYGSSWNFDPIRKTAHFNEVKSVTPHDVYVAADLKFAREMGQKEAWELITKIINMSSQDRDDIFGSIWLNNIAKLGFKEANVKYKTWCEEKKNQTISVGEVYIDEFGRKVLVTFATEVLVDFMFMDGSCGHLVTDKFRKRYPLKTDRHIDISSIIDGLQED